MQINLNYIRCILLPHLSNLVLANLVFQFFSSFRWPGTIAQNFFCNKFQQEFDSWILRSRSSSSSLMEWPRTVHCWSRSILLQTDRRSSALAEACSIRSIYSGSNSNICCNSLKIGAVCGANALISPYMPCHGSKVAAGPPTMANEQYITST